MPADCNAILGHLHKWRAGARRTAKVRRRFNALTGERGMSWADELHDVFFPAPVRDLSSALAIAWSRSIRSGAVFRLRRNEIEISSPVTAISATALWHRRSTVALPFPLPCPTFLKKNSPTGPASSISPGGIKMFETIKRDDRRPLFLS
jgi:hypothetical protein